MKPHPSAAGLMGGLGVLGCALVLCAGCAEIDDRPATWSYVHATVIQPNCTTANCHSDLSRTADLSFEDRDAAYTALTGRLCDPEADNPDAPDGIDHDFVVPYDPERSKLMYLLLGREVRVMPPDVPLADAEIELVERWILEGARCN